MMVQQASTMKAGMCRSSFAVAAMGRGHPRACRLLTTRVQSTLAVPDAVPADLSSSVSTTTIPTPLPTIAPSPPPAPLGVDPPATVYSKAVALGASKAALPAWKAALMGVIGGAYIGIGGFLALNVGGNAPALLASNPGLQKFLFGSVGLPFGLLMVVVCGAELFTGNTCFITAAVNEGKATWRQLIRNWTSSYIGNLIGSLTLVALICAAGCAASVPAAKTVAVVKTSYTFMQAFWRGALCNWLVCLALWQATAANTMAGKALGVYLPISAFVAMGLEHSVANMFLVPMGIACGAPVSFGTFLTSNLIPVTLGNMLGGMVFVAGAYGMIFGSAGKPKLAA